MAGKQVSYRVEKSNHPLKLAVTDIPTPQDKQILVKITVIPNPAPTYSPLPSQSLLPSPLPFLIAALWCLPL